MTSSQDIGRNEPCPCGSGKKYKRCCGVSAAPKLSLPSVSAPPPGGGGGFSPDQMDPAAMMKIAQLLQRLPKGQMQRLQALMQKAMSGKDVSREAEEFEATLPVEFQEVLHAMKIPGMGGEPPAPSAVQAPAPEASTEMTPEQARELVANAAKEGKISETEAQQLLGSEEKKGISKFFGWGKK